MVPSSTRKKRFAFAALPATAMLAVMLVPAAPAQAASDTAVSIGKISNVKLKGKTKKAIAPKVRAGKAVTVASKRITVKQGKKTVVRNKARANLKAGKYKVTTIVKYKTQSKSTRLVSDGSVAVPMSCRVADTELNNVEGFDVTLMFLDCTGKFDGVYNARMGYVNDPDLREFIGANIWGDSFVEHPNEVPAVIGTKFAAKVLPVERPLYLTEVKQSAMKTKKRTQNLKVSK